MAEIYWYPSGGTLKSVTLSNGADVAQVREKLTTQGGQRQAFAGRIVTAPRARRWEVLVEIPAFTEHPTGHRDDRADLASLVDHLQRGGLCGVAAYDGEAYLAFERFPVGLGTTTILHFGCTGWDPNASLADERPVYREMVANGVLHRELLHTDGAVSGGASSITVHNGTTVDVGAPGWLRQEGYHPACRLVMGEEPRDFDELLAFGFSLRLLVDLSVLQDQAGWDTIYTGTSAEVAGTTTDAIFREDFRTI